MKTLLADLWFVEVSGDAGTAVDDLNNYLRAQGERDCTLETFGCVCPSSLAMHGGRRAAELLAVHPHVNYVTVDCSRMDSYCVEVADAGVWRRIQSAAEENLLSRELIYRGRSASALYIKTSDRVIELISRLDGVQSVSKVVS